MPKRKPPQRPKFIVYVDANALLFLYEHYDPKLAELATKLSLAADSIFLTQQVVDEIERNKLRIARETLDDALKKLVVPPNRLPFGLKSHLPKLRGANQKLKATINAIERSAQDHLRAVSQSEDEISKTLATLYACAAMPSDEVLERARRRRERGNPPGKAKDPLGDQISWEQLLDQVAHERPTILWIVTGDQDYIVKNIGTPTTAMLNPILKSELTRRAPGCTVRIYEKKDIAEAINDYLNEQGLADQQFTDQELAYYEHLAEEDERHRKPWECKMDGAQTPIAAATCTRCGEELDQATDEDDYMVNEVQNGYELTLSPDTNDNPETCPNCGSTVFNLDFESFCSYCTRERD